MSIVKGRGVPGQGTGMQESGEGGGCFALRVSRVAVL